MNPLIATASVIAAGLAVGLLLLDLELVKVLQRAALFTVRGSFGGA